MGTNSPPHSGRFVSQDKVTVAFSRPGGETSRRAGRRPIDLEHLARQTMGDRALEQEVLALFSQHIGAVRNDLKTADEAERRRLGHTLKGAARSIGAFMLADCAERMEANPGDKTILSRVNVQIGELRDFIAAISR